MNPTKQLNLRLEKRVWEAFEQVADESHLHPTKYATVWLSLLSDLKPEHALDALSAIPKHFFRARSGSPAPSGRTSTRDFDSSTRREVENVPGLEVR